MPDHQKKTDKQVAIGVEITRSRATIVLVDRHGKIHHRFYAKTLRGRPASATLEPYFRAIETVLMHAKSERMLVSGLGISIPGTLDLMARRPQTIPILPSLNGFPLCDLLEARYNLPAQLLVDVDAGLLGEYHFGAGKGFRRLLFLNVNTVVGAALIIDGKLEPPEQEYVGHVCHMPVSMSGPRCSCGKYGCINTLISMEAMQKMVQRAVRRGEQTNLIQRLSNREHFSPELLAQEALRGDSVALQVYCEVGRWLGAATAKYINIYEPDVLILDGGVLCANELLIAYVRSSLVAQPSAKTGKMLEIVPSRLGSDAALIGAGVPFLKKSLTEQIESAQRGLKLNVREEEQPMTAEPFGMQEPEEAKFNFSQGQSVRIVEGPFTEFVGKVIESNREQKKVTVLISYFGKETPFVFDFRQVEKIEPFFT